MPENPIIPAISRGYDDSDRNRALDTRRDTDEFKTPSITIYDIDYAILHHLNENIQFQVKEKGNVIKVHVVMANGERWSQIQNNGYLRDDQSKIMTPVIALKPGSIQFDERMRQLNVPGNNRGNTIHYYPASQHNNMHDRINQSDNTKKSIEYYAVPIPVFIRVPYELLVWTSTTEQMNKIIEDIMTQDRLPWGDVFKFTANIDGEISRESSVNTGEDRLIRCTVPLLVDGMLVSEFTLRESSVQKSFTTKRINFMNEREEYNIVADYMPQEIHSQRTKVPKFGME